GGSGRDRAPSRRRSTARDVRRKSHEGRPGGARGARDLATARGRSRRSGRAARPFRLLPRARTRRPSAPARARRPLTTTVSGAERRAIPETFGARTLERRAPRGRYPREGGRRAAPLDERAPALSPRSRRRPPPRAPARAIELRRHARVEASAIGRYRGP